MSQSACHPQGVNEPLGKMQDNTINNDMTMGGATGALLAGRYRVVCQLGQGGMGSVWLAEDMKLDGFKVAIKMLPSVLVNNKRAYVQVKAEALVSLKLSHPNIATVRAFEEESGSPFLVMDYIDGQTLDDYLAEKGKLAEDEAIRLLKPVAAALDYAHTQGVVHRDVKPGNVMIAKDGTPYVLDFGIAREIQETMTRVTGKLSSGTLLYMSPEQLHGAAPSATQDIYSFAAMTYECLTGNPPFARGQIEYQIEHDIPARLSVSDWLACGVMSGLDKSPIKRPNNCCSILQRQSPIANPLVNWRLVIALAIGCCAVFAVTLMALLGTSRRTKTVCAVAHSDKIESVECLPNKTLSLKETTVSTNVKQNVAAGEARDPVRSTAIKIVETNTLSVVKVPDQSIVDQLPDGELKEMNRGLKYKSFFGVPLGAAKTDSGEFTRSGKLALAFGPFTAYTLVKSRLFNRVGGIKFRGTHSPILDMDDLKVQCEALAQQLEAKYGFKVRPSYGEEKGKGYRYEDEDIHVFLFARLGEGRDATFMLDVTSKEVDRQNANFVRGGKTEQPQVVPTVNKNVSVTNCASHVNDKELDAFLNANHALPVSNAAREVHGAAVACTAAITNGLAVMSGTKKFVEESPGVRGVPTEKATQEFLGLKLGEVYKAEKYNSDGVEKTLKWAMFTPTKKIRGFDEYYVYVTPKTHRIAKIFAGAVRTIDPDNQGRDHYFLKHVCQMCNVKYKVSSDERSWMGSNYATYKMHATYYTFDISQSQHVMVGLRNASQDYQSIFMAWDDLMLSQASKETIYIDGGEKEERIIAAVKAFESKDWTRGIALSKGIENDDARIQFYIGYCYNCGCAGMEKDLKTAAEWCRKSAENGYAKAQNMMGLICEKGMGVETNKTEAVKWFRIAAENGDVNAQKELARRYAEGRGVDKNATVSFEWYLKAAKQGDAAAQNSVGLMYGTGNGVPKNSVEAFKWNLRAAEQGDSIAQSTVGCMYARGIGVDRDMDMAIQWWNRSAEQGDEKAKGYLKQWQVGSIFEDTSSGKSISGQEFSDLLNDKKLMADAKGGDANAQYYLALAYEGAGNGSAAIEWYTKGYEHHDKGSGVFAESIANIYHFGIGVAKDEKKAIEWWKNAVKFGSVRAKKELQKRNIR